MVEHRHLATVCFLADAQSVLTQRWLRHAADRGDTVHVVTLDPSSASLTGVREHLVGRRIPRRVPRSLRMVLAIPEVRALVRRLRPDVVHSHYAWGFGIWGAATGRHPLVVSVWGTDVMSTPHTSRLHAAVFRWVLRSADVLCATSADLARATSGFTDKPVVVTPFGVDTDLFHPAITRPAVPGEGPRATCRFGMVKRLDANSGIEVLLRAMALPQVPAGATLDVIGAAPDDRWLELAAELGLSARVRFLGLLPSEEVAHHLREWDVAIQPSRWVEGFGVSALEASASGIPVVATGVGGLAEVVRDGVTGLLVPPNDAEALANAMAALATDPALRARLGAGGREWVVGRYDRGTAEETMDRVYDEVLGGSQ